jgi:hypothetical protein
MALKGATFPTSCTSEQYPAPLAEAEVLKHEIRTQVIQCAWTGSTLAPCRGQDIETMELLRYSESQHASLSTHRIAHDQLAVTAISRARNASREGQAQGKHAPHCISKTAITFLLLPPCRGMCKRTDHLDGHIQGTQRITRLTGPRQACATCNSKTVITFLGLPPCRGMLDRTDCFLVATPKFPVTQARSEH